VSRLETMVLQAGVNYPMRAIRQQIASALHLVVHVARSADGRRSVESVAEFGALDPQDDLPVRELFRRDGEGALRFVAAPTFLSRLQRDLRPRLDEALARLQ